jgi:hypothetical protein
VSAYQDPCTGVEYWLTLSRHVYPTPLVSIDAMLLSMLELSGAVSFFVISCLTFFWDAHLPPLSALGS